MILFYCLLKNTPKNTPYFFCYPLKWSKESRFFAGRMVVENWFSAQYAPAREERQFFIISYNRKKQNERQTRIDTRA